MTSYVYLIRRENFFLIGNTRNLQKEMRVIKPDEILETLVVDNPEAFTVRLLRRYRDVRLPESGYFQLSEEQLLDCKKQFGVKSKIPKTIGAEFYIAITGSVVLFLLSSFIFEINDRYITYRYSNKN